MHEPLDLVIRAHGGLHSWSRVREITTDLLVQATTGLHHDWAVAGERMTLAFSTQGMRAVMISPSMRGAFLLQPGLITFQHDGYAESLTNAHTWLQNDVPEPGDPLRIAYLVGCGVRQFLSAPFNYSPQDTWVERFVSATPRGEFAALSVQFSENPELPLDRHLAYYGADGLLRIIKGYASAFGSIRLEWHVARYQLVEGLRLPQAVELLLFHPAEALAAKWRMQLHLDSTVAV